MNSDGELGPTRSMGGTRWGSVIFVIGGVLGVVHVAQALRITNTVRLGIGALVPLTFAVALGAAGAWVRMTDRPAVLQKRLAVWTVIGGLWMAVVAVGAITYQVVGGVGLDEPTYYTVVFVTYGTLPGFVVGWYDGRRVIQTERVSVRDRRLREANDQLNLVLNAASLGFWDWNVQTDEVTFGGQYAELLDHESAEIGDSPQAWEERIHPDDRPAVERAIRAHFDGETDFYRTTHRKRTSEGDWKWIRDVGKVVERDENGEPLRAIGINEDITPLKERERELEETKERLDLAVAGANLGVWDWDMRTDDVSRDERWVGMLGYSPGEIESDIGGWEALLHPADRERHDRALQRHLAGEAEYYRCEYRLRSKSGEWKWIRNIGKVFDRDENGDPIRSVGIHQDVDERKRTYQQLERKTDQLEALNRVVRHDIRNDMNVIYGWAQSLEDHVDQQGREALTKVLSVSEHVIELTEVAREFVESLGGEQRLELEPVDLLDHLETELDAQRQSYPEAEYSLEAPDSTIRVRANEMLSSVFRNLLANAVQHNPNETPAVAVDVQVVGDWVEVEIADDGPGIPDERKETVFGRSEKGLESGGTGIGLYLVDTLVDGYGGDVRVEDNDPEGSVFTVRLPTAE